MKAQLFLTVNVRPRATGRVTVVKRIEEVILILGVVELSRSCSDVGGNIGVWNTT